MFFTSTNEAAAFYRKQRVAAITSARECRKVLTDPNGYWRLAADHERVRSAVTFWVARARKDHRMLMGWEPIINNFAVITDSGQTAGKLYTAACNR